MERIFYKIICTIIILMFLCCNVVTFATSTSELNNEIDEINNSIQQKENEKAQVENEKSDMLKQVEILIGQISGYENEIETLKEQIETLENEIKVAEEKLAEEEGNYTRQEELLKQRLIIIYELGDTSFLDLLLGSQDLGDFISNYYLASEVTKCDTELLETIEQKKNEIAATKQGLEEKKEKLQQTKETAEKTSQALYEAKQVKAAKASELSSEEQKIKDELEAFEEDRNRIQAELRRIAEEEARKNGGYTNVTPSACGYIKPVAGYSITTGLYYSTGAYHGGVDYSGSGIYGKPIVAVKSGTVVTSTALRYSNGNYKSYGEYIVINHHDGTMTLYAHGQSGSRKVYEGDYVSQGQTIMNVGSTGNSTGPHLHFEVRVNGSRVSPYPYLP